MFRAKVYSRLSYAAAFGRDELGQRLLFVFFFALFSGHFPLFSATGGFFHLVRSQGELFLFQFPIKLALFSLWRIDEGHLRVSFNDADASGAMECAC